MDFSKISRWLLPASLAVNAFLGGMLTTHLLHERLPPHHHGGPPPPGRILEEMAGALPPADARILRDAVTAKLPDLEAAWRAEREAPERLREILRHEPFDQAAFRQQLEGRDSIPRMLATILPDAAAKMSPEGRRALADWEPHPPPGGPHGPPPDGPPGPGPFR